MIQIRQDVFETNSSSSHSIVVTKDAKKLALAHHGPNGYASYENGILRLGEDNNFGWGWEILTDWLDKFAYAVADFQYDESALEDLLKRMQIHLDCSVIVIPRRKLWNDPHKTEPDYGYVDHQSCGTLREFLTRRNVSVMDFIFSDKYVVVLDNDNNYRDRYHAFIDEIQPEDEFPAEC